MKRIMIFILMLVFSFGIVGCENNENPPIGGNENQENSGNQGNNENQENSGNLGNNENQENSGNQGNNENQENSGNQGNTEINSNPFISTTGIPMLCAHRGGAANNPENTLKAYKYAVEECYADILESDVYLTKDEQLVLMHDSTVTRTSDAQSYLGRSINLSISDFTLEELKELNFGARFSDSTGAKPYSNIVSNNTSKEDRKRIIAENEVSILTLDELLGYFYESNKELLFVIEIKNTGEAGYKSAQIINQLLEKYPDYAKRLCVSTFNNGVLEYLKTNYPDMIMGAATSDAEVFVKSVLFGAPAPQAYEFNCLQIPTSYALGGQTANLADSKIIEIAHKNNISVQYWTINDAATMRKLIELKCDAIMTDNPKVLRQVLDEIK